MVRAFLHRLSALLGCRVLSAHGFFFQDIVKLFQASNHSLKSHLLGQSYKAADMVLNPFRCKQYWVSSILERNTLLAKIQTNKKKLTLFSEGCWYPYRELQNYTFLIYRGIFLYVFGLTFEFSFLLTEGDSSPTLSGMYTSGRTLSKVSCFDFEMPLAKPTCRRSVQECLSWFWSSTNSSCILTLPQAETRLCLHI